MTLSQNKALSVPVAGCGPDRTTMPVGWAAPDGEIEASWAVDPAASWTAKSKLGTSQDLMFAIELSEATGQAWRKNGVRWETYDVAKKIWIAMYDAAPVFAGARGYGPDYVIYWGLPETKDGDDCGDPFRGGPRGICDPAQRVVYARFRPGGYILKR